MRIFGNLVLTRPLRYLISLSVKGNFNFSLIDYNGQTFDTTTSADGSIIFTLNDDNAVMGLTGTTFEDNVEVVYKATQLVAGVATITETAAAPTSPSAGSRPALAVGLLAGLVLMSMLLLVL